MPPLVPLDDLAHAITTSQPVMLKVRRMPDLPLGTEVLSSKSGLKLPYPYMSDKVLLRFQKFLDVVTTE